MFSLQQTVSTRVQLLLQLSTSLLTACRSSGRLDVALQRSQARSKCKFRIANGWMGHDRHEVLFLRLSNNRRSKRDTRLFTSMSSVPHYCEKPAILLGPLTVKCCAKLVQMGSHRRRGWWRGIHVCMSENLMKQEQKLANSNWMNSFCFRFH